MLALISKCNIETKQAHTLGDSSEEMNQVAPVPGTTTDLQLILFCFIDSVTPRWIY